MTRSGLVLVGVLAACAPAPVVPPGGALCGEACTRMRACALGRPATPDGATCEEVCTAMAREGVDFGAACLARASSCVEARACP